MFKRWFGVKTGHACCSISPSMHSIVMRSQALLINYIENYDSGVRLDEKPSASASFGWLVAPMPSECGITDHIITHDITIISVMEDVAFAGCRGGESESPKRACRRSCSRWDYEMGNNKGSTDKYVAKSRLSRR